MDTPPSPSMAVLSEEIHASPTDEAAVPLVAVAGPRSKVIPLRVEVNHEQLKPASTSEVAQPTRTVSEESLPAKAIYPPPVSPTQTFQPPAPPLAMMHVAKSPTSANPPNSKFKRWSRRRSDLEPRSPPMSPVTDNLGKINPSGSIASSSASSAYSANSATIQIPQPGTNAYTLKPHRKRQQSDPKYLRFMSTISQNQRQTSPEQYVGYPGLASHMTETQNLIFRRFDDVHVRLLLYLQDQISQLEAQLRTLDERNIAESGIHNGTFREDADKLRVDTMEKLRICVGEYDTMILAFSKMQESKASEKSVARLKDWLKKYSGGSNGRQSLPKGGAIAREELEWVEKVDDLTYLPISTAASSTPVKQSSLTRLFAGKKG
ncbi:hypothetical protein EPUS_09052 [Endocarpon pusillum Z07020]|uniref:DUF6594 domain-containing protein n=1 Tax=Endocarpon pusillum (strain Z07020 / HMAS-L-300199) TaxID=1263415 RepID=U1HM61_ENDPU|nr:uncharacterized protein EPUS_09052 [Endocarpon pusillum Z07020]ERF71380.1 hypothetical protein EPUS_09052 [Endocarpon pusillum Z07020]